MHEPEPGALGPDERGLLLALARETLRRSVAGETAPEVQSCKLPPGLTVCKGCFVTLTQGRTLRGCVGNVEPRWPLWQAVVENSRAAGTKDTRFRPVERDELERIQIEISILTRPVLLPFTTPEALLARLEPGRDGVLIEIGSRRATFLPQVWEKVPNRSQFMSQLAVKAGAGPEDWRRNGVVVYTYQVEHFTEPTSSPR